MAATATGKSGFCFNDAVFTYSISNQQNDMFEKHLRFFKNNLVINYTKKTDVLTYQHEKESVCIIGFCIDSHGCVVREEIPEYIVKNGHGDIQAVLEIHYRLAGKYVVLYENAQGLYAFTDAVGELMVHYYTGDEVCLSSIDELVARQYGLKASEKALDLRNGSYYGQPMLYDLTLYDQVKVLLPNHYLDVYASTVHRYFPARPIAKQKLDDVVERTLFLVTNIVKEFVKNFDLINSLTAGWDTRCNLAFLQKQKPDIPCFTHHHPYFTDKTADYYIPPLVCKQQNVQLFMIDDLQPPSDYLEDLTAVIGNYHAEDTISYGYSIAQSLPGKAIVNGDVLGTIAVDAMSQNLPRFVATPKYFRAKLHNYSKYAIPVIKEHLAEIRQNPYGAENIYDIFSLENRCGRWQSQIHMIYSVMGVNDTNFYNCMELLELWIGLSRKERKDIEVHRKLFKILDPHLTDIPLNPNEAHAILFEYQVLFYLATRGKYLLEKWKRP